MCNSVKNSKNNEGIMMFKDTMEYLIDGLISAEQYAELTRMIYATRWGDGIDDSEIEDKMLLLIWKTLKHSIQKSVRNAKHYEKKMNGKQSSNALNKVQETEFDLPPVEEIPCKEEPENKAGLSQLNTKNGNLYHEEIKVAETGIKSLLNDNVDIEKRPVIKVAASLQVPQVDVQELLNDDDELCADYVRYIKKTIEHEDNPTSTSYNTMDMAKVRLEETLKKYNIKLSSIKDFINNDKCCMRINNTDVA